MLKKIEQSAQFLAQNLSVLACPICQSSFSLQDYSLVCQNHHSYNLSKKGTVNFLQTKADTEHYTRKMFEPRRRLIEAGMYAPVLREISGFLAAGNWLDIGCGEGSFLGALRAMAGASLADEVQAFGFDIAKDAVNMATELDFPSFFALADLTHLPYADASFSTLLNLLTPSNYAEFKRVLAPKGRLIKLVPDHDYLKELRQAYQLPLNYDNSAVIDRFKQEFPETIQREIHSTFSLPEHLRQDFLAMSPLEWTVSDSAKQAAQQNPPSQATIHIQLLIAEK